MDRGAKVVRIRFAISQLFCGCDLPPIIEKKDWNFDRLIIENIFKLHQSDEISELIALMIDNKSEHISLLPEVVMNPNTKNRSELIKKLGEYPEAREGLLVYVLAYASSDSSVLIHENLVEDFIRAGNHHDLIIQKILTNPQWPKLDVWRNYYFSLKDPSIDWHLAEYIVKSETPISVVVDMIRRNPVRVSYPIGGRGFWIHSPEILAELLRKNDPGLDKMIQRVLEVNFLREPFLLSITGGKKPSVELLRSVLPTFLEKNQCRSLFVK